MALSTSPRNRSAAALSSVMMDSVWCEPWRRMCSIAPATPSTTLTEMMGSRYSVSQSAGFAATTRSSSARVASSPRASQPAAMRSSRIAGRWLSATFLSTSRVSAAPQMPGRRILALSVTLRAMPRSAAPST